MNEEKKYVLRVQKLIQHEDGKHLKFEEAFVNVPAELYEGALADKKSTKTLNWYTNSFKGVYLKKHNKLCEYIERIVGRFDWANIERINIY